MLKMMKKYFNRIYIFHGAITKKTRFGLSNIGTIFFLVMIVFVVVNNLVNTENLKYTINKIYAYFLVCFTLLLMPYFQIISFIFKKDIKNKKINRVKFCSSINYLKYCVKTTFIVIASFWFVLKILFEIDILKFLFINTKYFFIIFSIIFSIISIFWFSYIIIYKLLDEQIIKAKLNLFIAIASTLNLLQINEIKEYIISFSIIIVSYRWINYLIEEKKLWYRNGT